MKLNQIILTSENGKQTFVFLKSLIGGFSYREDSNHINLFFTSGMSWLIDNTKENIEKLKSLFGL